VIDFTTSRSVEMRSARRRRYVERLDVMQHLAGLGGDGGGWAELSKHAIRRNFLGHECLFCSYEDLIRMKRGAGRPQDQIDVASLKAARGEI
jgi:hypothetical protein